jgi:hypothetical protein
MIDLEYLMKALGKDPSINELHDFSERVGIIMDNGEGELTAQRVAFNQIYG